MTWPDDWCAIVVDNDEAGSALAVVEAIRGDFPVPLSVVAESSPGYASVRNRAIAEAKGSIALCFFDDDMVAGPGWLVEMNREHLRDPEAIVHSRIRRLDQVPDSSVAMDALSSDSRGIPQMSHGGTGGSLIPTSAFKSIGGFDQRYDETGGEDTDFMLRAKLRLIPFRIAPAAFAFEEDRRAAMSVPRDAALAFDSGRLYMDIVRRNNQATTRFRLRAAVGVAPPALRLGLGMISSGEAGGAARTVLRLLCRRLGVATAPWREQPGGPATLRGRWSRARNV